MGGKATAAAATAGDGRWTATSPTSSSSGETIMPSPFSASDAADAAAARASGGSDYSSRPKSKNVRVPEEGDAAVFVDLDNLEELDDVVGCVEGMQNVEV